MKTYIKNHPETVATIAALLVFVIVFTFYIWSLTPLQYEHLIHY